MSGLVPSAEDEPLVRAVLAAPDDDAPRLVYADRLLERGEAALGELIVLQCRARQHALRPPSASGHALERRARELVEANLGRWMADLHDAERWTLHLDRGFIDRLTVSSAESLFANQTALALHPLRELRVSIAAEELERSSLAAILAAPFARQLENLRVAFADGICVALAPEAARRRLARVGAGRFSVADAEIGGAIVAAEAYSSAAAARVLAAPPARLTRLDLVVTGAIGQARFDLPHLRALSVVGPGPLARQVLADAALPALQSLTLRGSEAEPATPRALAESALLPQLERLETAIPLDIDLAIALATRAARLTALHLCGPARERALEVLVRSELAPRLRELHVSSLTGLEASVITHGPFEELRSLELYGFTVTEEDARALVASFPSLEVLKLSRPSKAVGALLARRWPSYAEDG